MTATATDTTAGTTTIPSWTFGDRMAKARNHAGLTQGEIAERIGIARQSAVNYERDKTRPLEAILRAWLEVTGVDEHWLRTGCDCHNAQTCTSGLLPRVDSNHQSSGYWFAVSPPQAWRSHVTCIQPTRWG